MKNILTAKNSLMALFIALVIALGGAGSASAQVKRKPVLKKRPVARKVVAKPAIKYYSVPTGETINVKMNETLSSKTAAVGDTFTTRTTDPVYSTTGVVVIPQGSTVTGRVDRVKAAAKGGKPGEIDVTFVEVRLPNGTRKVINGSLTDLDTKKGKSDSEGSVSGDKTAHRKVIFTGAGGVGGAVLGGVIGGGKGAVIGGIAGAIGGFITEKQTKGENVEVKSGTEFGVYLNRAVSLPKFTEVDN
jgi:hypothetical protein